MKPRDPGDLVTLRFRLGWLIPVLLGILLFILGLLTGRSHGFPAYVCHNRSNHAMYLLPSPVVFMVGIGCVAGGVYWWGGGGLGHWRGHGAHVFLYPVNGRGTGA